MKKKKNYLWLQLLLVALLIMSVVANMMDWMSGWSLLAIVIVVAVFVGIIVMLERKQDRDLKAEEE